MNNMNWIVEIELIALIFLSTFLEGGTPQLFIFIDDPHHRALDPMIPNKKKPYVVYSHSFTPFGALSCIDRKSTGLIEGNKVR
jgi:hypothetical protein